MASTAFTMEMDRKQGTTPRTKVEFIDKSDNATDVTDHYLAGANFEQVRERAPDEIQAGQFDIVFANHDDLFSEYVSGSLLENLDYHGARIRVSQGFLLPNGALEYETQGVLYIDQLVTSPTDSTVTLRCRDLMGRIMDQKLHARPDDEIPAAGGSNVGDGIVSGFGKLPFVAVNQDWTLTCTLGGADDVATFSVVGSVSGDIGTATSGTDFIDALAGIRFTIRGGDTNWSIGDVFTFSTHQHPEWSGLNAGKIIWSILTGYDWDSDTQEPFSGLVFDLDHTQSDANVELDYLSFATAISAIDAIGVFALKGYAPFDTSAIELMQSLLVLFLGSLYTGNDGRIKLKTYIPAFTPQFRTYSDTRKVMALSYRRGIDEVINHVSVDYKGSDSWPWSTESLTLDGHFVDKDATSITDRGQFSQDFSVPWYSSGGNHVQDFASKLISRFKDPPLNVEFTTGLDALLTEVGDRIIVEDAKTGLADTIGEVTRIVKQFDQMPAAIQLRMRQDSTTYTLFGAIGSEEDEGDGLSPQTDDYDSATDAEKQFAYFSESGNSNPPQYSIF